MSVTRRNSIVLALVQALKQISHQNGFLTDLGRNVQARLVFWDQINQFPALNLTSGQQTIEYQGGGFKDRYLSILIRCYVNQQDSVLSLQKLLEDVQNIIDKNGRLAYITSSGKTQYTRDIEINSIDTDQGALSPLGAGEVILRVKY